MDRPQLRAFALPTALVVVAIILLFQLYAYWQQSRPVFDAQGQLLRLPEFVFPMLEGDGTCSPDKLPGGPVVVVYYGPDCGHCKKLGREVASRHTQHSRINWLFVSRATADEARAYAQETGLAMHSSVRWCRDEQARFYHYFGDMYIPSIYIFDADHQFLQSLHQNTQFDDILSVLDGKFVARPKESR